MLLKPFQASAAILEGATESAGFTNEEIALMCASHNGEEIHVKTAKGMVNKLDLNVSYLECGCHPPYDVDARNRAREIGFTPFHNNCSGKHSGMLSLAIKLGAKTNNYVSYNHPVQQKIFEQLKRLTGKNNFHYGIDGCSAPTPFLTLKEIAKLFQVFGLNKFPELTTTYNAMAKHPYLIAGKDRFDTDFNKAMTMARQFKASLAFLKSSASVKVSILPITKAELRILFHTPTTCRPPSSTGVTYISLKR